jgi:hypothetical protein
VKRTLTIQAQRHAGHPHLSRSSRPCVVPAQSLSEHILGYSTATERVAADQAVFPTRTIANMAGETWTAPLQRGGQIAEGCLTLVQNGRS